MRTLSLPAGFAFLLACILVPAHAADQQPQPTPAEAPPAAQSADEADQPGITVRQGQPQNQVTETRQGGKVTQIKVRKSKNNTYVIRPGQGSRDAAAQGTHTNPAQWVVKEIGPGKEPKKKDNVPPPVISAPATQDTNAPEKK